MRRPGSLLGRLLRISLAVLVLAVVGTAVGAAVIVDRGVQHPPGQAQAQTAVYGSLLSYAAAHRSWTGVASTVVGLARRERVRVQLTSLTRQVLADGRPTGVATAQPSAVSVVDALNVNRGLTSIDAPQDIFPLRRNPLSLPRSVRRGLRSSALQALACVHAHSGGHGRLVRDSAHDLTIVGASQHVLLICDALKLSEYEVLEHHSALAEVRAIATPCLHARGLPQVTLGLDYSFSPPRNASAGELADIRSCITGARRVQLTPYVAPPALLLIGGRLASDRLSGGDVAAIAALALAVLLLALVVTTLAGRRVSQPLRSLTAAVAADAPAGETLASARVPREVAALAEAFDDGRRARQRLEAQRRESISDIAHELRTPLSNIRAWLEARRDGLADEPSVDERLLGEALVLQSVVDDLQLLSTADSGELRLVRERFDLAELLDQVADGHRAAAGPYVVIEVDVERPLVVDADRLRVRRVLDNLVSNAIRAVAEGAEPGRVRVVAWRRGGRVVVDVEDTGTGIAAVDVPRLFDRFWRADRSRARASGGSGLGLAIARELVVAHGGSITAHSAPGGPTRLRFTLPER